MNARLRLSLMTTCVVLLGVLAIIALAATSGGEGGSADGIQHAESPFEGATRRGAPSPAFRLRDQDGRPATLGDVRGRTAIVTFLYSTCEDTCPAAAAQIASSLDELGDVPTLIVSVDPENDTPANAQRFLNKMRLRDRARFLLGRRGELAPVWRSYAVQPQGEDFEHSAVVLVLDAQGRQQVSWPVEKLTAEGLTHDVRAVQALDARAR